MDEQQIIKEILSSYDEIELLNEDEGIIYFRLYNDDYGLAYPHLNNAAGRPVIILKNNDQYNHPHIMLSEMMINGDSYRYVCLHETGSQVEYLIPYQEKIVDIVSRLMNLLNLSPVELEEEFQKEFLFYWNQQAQCAIDAYISTVNIFQKINVYTNRDKICRLVSSGIRLNDKEKFTHLPNTDVYYIPIIDNRGIKPPIKNGLWKSSDILKILRGRDIKRISSETYSALKSERVTGNEVIFIFEMLIKKQKINFGVKIVFKRSSRVMLLEKIEYAISNLIYIKVNRSDYHFLNTQIGNDVSIIGTKVGLVGGGSLGSYIATELVKSGIKNLTIYDPDIIEEANVLRHNSDYLCCGKSKVNILKERLQKIHPEIVVEANQKYVTEQILESDMNKYDLLIFTVGSSDVQLSANQMLKMKGYSRPVIYAWLEAGGTSSHILCVNYLREGCFECLYTDVDGGLINNKVNKMTDDQVEMNVLRTGCGATRVAYGTDILLRTTSAVLNTVQRVFNGQVQQNILIDIDKETVIQQGNKFIESRCNCCGDSDRE